MNPDIPRAPEVRGPGGAAWALLLTPKCPSEPRPLDTGFAHLVQDCLRWLSLTEPGKVAGWTTTSTVTSALLLEWSAVQREDLGKSFSCSEYSPGNSH